MPYCYGSRRPWDSVFGHLHILIHPSAMGTAYDDGGSPIKEYQLYADEVEGVALANIEQWSQVYTGTALTFDL